MGLFNVKKDDYYNNRSHQDNFKWSETDHEEWDNGHYQFCRFCNAMRNFKYDRCTTCKNQ